MSRETILGRIGAALGPTASHDEAAGAVADRLAHPPRHPRPAFAETSGAAREARLVACLETQGASVISIADLAALPAAVADLLHATSPPSSSPSHAEACLDPDLRRGDGFKGETGSTTTTSSRRRPGSRHAGRIASPPDPRESEGRPHRLYLGDDPRLAALPWPPPLTPERWTPAETLGDGYAALTHAEAAVAETGTLVLASSPASPASLAFLPEVHLVAVRRDTIVAAFEDAFATLTAATPGRLPRAINLVSGPSRTADVGGQIVKGAHGPRRLAVFLYGPPQS